MTTQTQATYQVLTDEQLEALNGAGTGALFGWAIANVPTLGIPIAIDQATGFNVTRAALNHSY